MAGGRTNQVEAGRVILITGASRGIGRALAGCLAAEGCALGLLARNGEELERVAAELREKHGTRAMPLPCDLRDNGQVEGAVEQLLEMEGHLDGAVLSAGILGELVPTVDSNPARWTETLTVNLTGSYFAARAAARAMMRLRKRSGEGAGRLLFVSSGAGRPPRSPWGAYAVSKCAVDGLMAVMAAEAPQTGVLAASVNPGGTATSMRAEAYPDEDPATLPSARQVAEELARILRLPDDQFNGRQLTVRGRIR